MKKNVKAMYVAPVVELLEARVEKGFAGSGEDGTHFNPSELEPVPQAPVNNINDAFMGM